MASTLQLLLDDPWLQPYQPQIEERHQRYLDRLKSIEAECGSLSAYANRHRYLGFNYNPQEQGWWYREWAPAAEQLWLIGDFNSWHPTTHPLYKNKEGIWEIFIPDGPDGLKHQQKVKVKIQANNQVRDRLPAYITRAIQDPETHDFSGQIWHPEKKYTWQSQTSSRPVQQELFIYEAHIGMAQEKQDVGTYREFADITLPWIASLGYTAVQLMAIHEHPYYGSYGYHVANFFAPTSRFGTPEDLKYLIDKAHQMGIIVIMDLVHSHAVKNIAEGLADFDGSGNAYFYEGGRGYHSGWDSMLFDYGKEEVLRFLLSNIRYWLEEFQFDGFRFDGVTSIMYHHHGEMVQFDHYDKYFNQGINHEAILYLQLANTLTQQVKIGAISIAEDMSGMPGISRPVAEGGIGFDYRLGMGIPDFWIKLLKHTPDEHWSVQEIWGVLANRRYKEKTVAYAESHDQSLVGDKTLAFWLMDKEMYWHMRKDDDHYIIDRGLALHKLIRLLSASLGGEAYLNFIGNEWGHPEWVDFPREGNNWSYQYARRQWSLVRNNELKYSHLAAFDSAMIAALTEHKVLSAVPGQQLNIDETNKVLIYERANLIFIINLSPQHSIPDYKFSPHKAGTYQTVLNTDRAEFGGHNRIDEQTRYSTDAEDRLSVYSPSRTGLVLKWVSA